MHVESHPYLPEWELLNYCKQNGIVLQAFAALGHSSEPKLSWKIRSSLGSLSGFARRRRASVARLGHPAVWTVVWPDDSKTPEPHHRKL